MSEEHLVYDESYCLLKIREGDERFFNLIFEKYRNRLFAYLFKITKSKESAEEIVLDVFLKLWHGREIIHAIEKLDAFLFRVAYYKAIDFFRTASRNPKLQQETWDLLKAAALYDQADQKLIENEMEEAMQEALNHLTPQRKKVYYLRNYEGLSYSEIARRLNLSQNTVRNHLSASIQFIREHLNKYNLTTLLLIILPHFWCIEILY